MIAIKNIKTLDGRTTDLNLASHLEQSIEAKERLLILPALIDPHLCLGSPHREDWVFGVESAVRGGIATLLDLPSKDSQTESKEELKQKKNLIDKQLADLKVPLHYFPYVKSNSRYIEELGSQKNLTKGSLLLFTPDDQELEAKTWDRIFQIAAWEDLPVVVNSRNENRWKRAGFKKADEVFLEKAIHYAERQNSRLYVLNVATQDEINLIQEARARSLLIYAETTPQHLFPKKPLQADFLWEALRTGIIETIGSGYHAEEQGEERLLWNGEDFDFLNPIFFLPLLLTAHQEDKISLENIVRLTRVNFYDIFKLEKENEDFVLVDLEKEQIVQRVNKNQSAEIKLKGWPEYIILKGHLFSSKRWGLSDKT